MHTVVVSHSAPLLQQNLTLPDKMNLDGDIGSDSDSVDKTAAPARRAGQL